MKDCPALTPAQQEAFDKASELLGEHFDASVISVSWITDDDDFTGASQVQYHGGAPTCIGLAVYATDLIRKKMLEKEEEEQE